MATVQSFLTFWLLFFLISMLYIGPTYYRRLGSLIDVLKTRHPEVFEELHRPSLVFMDITVRNSMSMIGFVLNQQYRKLDDEEAIQYGDEARWRLIYHIIGFGIILFVPFLAFVGG